MSKYIEKFRHLQQAIRQHGGLKGAYLQLYRTDELKWGDVVGEDQFGNKYYENKSYMMGRSRWVTYSDAVGLDYDGSQVPPEWHRWLHYIGDHPPTKVSATPRAWITDFKENLTGQDKQYVPYSTTRPKIEAWTPPKAN